MASRAADTGGMRLALALFAAVDALTVAPPAAAAETETDVETDHVTAADDGGPRSAGVLVHPLSMAAGWLGAELDAACGERVVMSVEGDERWMFGARGYRLDLGVALYPQRFSFHGIYVHPVVEWVRATGDGVGTSALGGGVTVGYAWTWLYGATVRLGGGAAYARALARPAGDGQGPIALDVVRPRIDADLGWVF